MNLTENQRAADGVSGLYQDLEEQLMANIIRHLRDYGQPIDSDDWQLQKLAEIGKLNKENLQIIARAAGGNEKAMLGMLEAVAQEVLQTQLEPGFAALVRDGLVEPAQEPEKSKNMGQAIGTLRKQARDTLNLCNTTMLYKARDAYKNLVQATTALANEYLGIMNQNAAGVVTGAMSRQEALRRTIKEFAQKGIPAFVDKAGREWTPEAYVNMAMRNTARNVADEMQDARCRDFGVDLVAIDAHAGARPKCAKDQGKIFSLSNKSGYTKDLKGKKIRYYSWKSSSYGEPDGILGINCGHHKFPFIPGVNIQRYFPTEDFDANDKLYRETQVQRALERDVRKQKRECMLFDKLDDREAFEAASVKLKQKEARLKDYVGSHSQLHRRKDREQVVGFDKGVSTRAVAANKSIAIKAGSMYDMGSRADNIKAYNRDLPIRNKIQSDAVNKALEHGQYRKHVPGTLEYKQYQDKQKRQGEYGPSYLTIDEETAQSLVNRYAGTGILTRAKDGRWLNEEVITGHTEDIGVAVDNRSGKSAPTSVFKIKYSPKNRGAHIIPDYPSKKGAKARK